MRVAAVAGGGGQMKILRPAVLAVLVALVAPAVTAAAEADRIVTRYSTDGNDTLLADAAAPETSGLAPFRWHIGGSTFYDVFDPVSYFGYNTAGAGGKIVPNEPMLSWNVEANYMQGATAMMETYFEMRNSSSTRNVRPLFLQVNRDTGSVTRFTFSGNEFGFAQQPEGMYDDPVPWLQLYPGAIEITPSSGKPAQLVMGTPAGEGSVLSMTWGGQMALFVHAIRPNHVKIQSGGGATIELIDQSVHVGGPIVMTSPNGTKWALSVMDDGSLKTTKR